MDNSTILAKGRDTTIDIIKAICILLMVACHTGIGDPFRKFVYFFHMPVFFIVSGYVYKSKYSDSFDAFVAFR